MTLPVLFVNEGIGGYRTVHAALRKVLAGRAHRHPVFLDVPDPGLAGRLARLPLRQEHLVDRADLVLVTTEPAAPLLWLSRFDPELRGVAPGHLLLQHLVERHDELGISHLGFGIGENADKLAWTTTGVDVCDLVAAPATGPGRLAADRLGAAGAAARHARTARTRLSSAVMIRPARLRPARTA